MVETVGRFAASATWQTITYATMNCALQTIEENVITSFHDYNLMHTWVMQQYNGPNNTLKSNSEWLKKTNQEFFEVA